MVRHIWIPATWETQSGRSKLRAAWGKVSWSPYVKNEPKTKGLVIGSSGRGLTSRWSCTTPFVKQLEHGIFKKAISHGYM
jgi:hypothetical protein